MTQALRQLREEAGLTREALASHLGISAVHIKKIESGERNPSRKVIHRMAALFRLPFAQLESYFPVRDPHQIRDEPCRSIRLAGSVPHLVRAYNARVAKTRSEEVRAG